MAGSFDILGLGAVAVDDLIYVDDYPEADSKVLVRRHERYCGGLTATALVAAARLGVRCAYAGVLGTDGLSEFAAGTLSREGVDLTLAKRRKSARVFHSHIIVGARKATRAILANAAGVIGADPAWPPAAEVRKARVLFVDHVGLRGMLRATRIARQAGIPVVADLERNSGPGFRSLFELVDHLIVSRDFATEHTGEARPDKAVLALWNRHRTAVVVTDGSRGCWYAGAGAAKDVQFQPAFKVRVVDTTGCGDVFHGAYAAGLAQGLGLAERVRLAAAVAALKATKPGGQAGCPSLAKVKRFLRGKA